MAMQGITAEFRSKFPEKNIFPGNKCRRIKNLGPAIELLAEAESLHGHKNAVSVRLKSLENG